MINMNFKSRYLIIFLVLAVVAVVLADGFYIYKKQVISSYAYTLAEFVQKQQTFSPYTKYEPSFVVDKVRGKIYYVFKAMDDNNIWQIWTATTDLDGNDWQQVQQTDSPENKQRPGIVYDPQDDLLYYFYRTGSEYGAAEKIPRRLITAVKKPEEEKWHDERELIGNDGIDDTIDISLDSSRHNLILVYTKDNQITTARMDLDKGTFQETVHTQTAEMNFIPNMAYDESGDTVYIVFSRARTPGTFDNKDLWLARVNGDGSNYREMRLTKTNCDNAWPFIILDLPRHQFYVVYRLFEEGTAKAKEKIRLGRANLDGSNWESRFNAQGIQIYGIDPETGVLYGTYGENNKHYFIVYDPEKDKLQKQLIPMIVQKGSKGDEPAYGDAAYRTWDAESGRLFGAQQVCGKAGERGIECQIWTYTGRVLKGEKSTLTPQAKAEMAFPQHCQLPEFKLIKAETFSNKIKINTNRKLSTPVEMRITSGGKEIKWDPSQLNPVDQDKGFELRFSVPLASYEVYYKVCALGDPSKPRECLEDTLLYSSVGTSGVSEVPGVFEGEQFTISIPQGWVQTQMPGTLVTITNINESHPQEPNAQKINFKSYFAVSSDNTQGRSLNQIFEEVKAGILQAISSASITGVSDETIDGMPAKFIELNLTQQDINFTVMLTIVMKGDKYFVISFNTTTNKRQEYKNLFYQTAKSFKFRY